MVFHLLHPLLGSKGYGTDRTHTARVKTGISLANALVVLGFRQYLIVFAISQYKNAALDAAHKFLDDHTTAGIAKHAAQHLLQFLLGFFEGREDEYTLTSTETVSLQHIGGLECFQEG